MAEFQPPVIEGYTDGTYRGGDALTRAQDASFLDRAQEQVTTQLGLPPLSTGVVGGFADVHASDVHAPVRSSRSSSTAPTRGHHTLRPRR